jgi:hypothetical protein
MVMPAPAAAATLFGTHADWRWMAALVGCLSCRLSWCMCHRSFTSPQCSCAYTYLHPCPLWGGEDVAYLVLLSRANYVNTNILGWVWAYVCKYITSPINMLPFSDWLIFSRTFFFPLHRIRIRIRIRTQTRNRNRNRTLGLDTLWLWLWFSINRKSLLLNKLICLLLNLIPASSDS